MHTIIIGNGIVAMSTAFRLAQRANPNNQITIVGRKYRPGSATQAAAAMLNSFAEIDAGGLDSEIDLFRFELSHLATRMWPKFEHDIIQAGGSFLPFGCSQCQGLSGGGCFSSGTYVINNTAADDLDDANFDAILSALKEFNESHELVTPSDIPNYMPDKRHRAQRAVLIHNEGWINPRLMLEKLDAVLARLPQVRFVDTHATQLLKGSNNLIEAVVTEHGETLSGDQFLVATGATATGLLNESDLGLSIQPIFYGVGVSLEIHSPEYPHTNCIRTPNRGLACGLYSAPYFYEPDKPNDHILIGASNYISPTPVPYGRVGSAESLLKGAMEQINFNFYRANLVRVNVGWRPTSQDTFPLVGKTSIPNLTIATGTKRDGFHMAPLLSQVLAALIHNEPIDERWMQFKPERQPIRNLSRQEAIDKAVRHQISAAYQHGFTPSKSRMPEQIERMLRDDLERLHDQVGALDWGIPPEMLDMYRYGHAKP